MNDEFKIEIERKEVAISIEATDWYHAEDPK